MRIIKILIFIITIIFSIAQIDLSQEKKPCRDIPLVMLEKAETKRLELSKSFSGKTYAKSVEIKSLMSGTITDIKVAVGDILTENWVIAEIDNTLAAEIKEINDNIKRWEKILKQRQNWAERSTAAEDQAQKNINKYKEDWTVKSKEAEKLKIKTTLPGTVDEILVNQSSPVDEGTVIAVIKNNKELLFNLKIDPEDQGFLNIGDQVKINFTKNNTTVTAKILKINNSNILFFIDNDDQSFKTENEFTLDLLTNKDDQAIFISPAVILEDADGSYVYIPEYFLDKIKSKKVYIKVGKQVEGKKWIKQGLKVGSDVIKTALHCLEDGKLINILYKNPKTNKFTMLKNQADALTVMEAAKLSEEKLIKEEKKEEVVEEIPQEEKPIEEITKPVQEEEVVEEKKEFEIIQFINQNKKSLKYFNFTTEFIDEDKVQIQLSGRYLNVKKLTKMIEKYKYDKFCLEKIDGIKTFYALVYKGEPIKIVEREEGFLSKMGAFLFAGVQLTSDEILKTRLGNTLFRFGVALDFDIHEGFGAFVNYTNQNNKGELSAQGETTLAQHIILAGARYDMDRFFVKGGISYVFFTETNDSYPDDPFSDSAMGFYIGGGAKLLIKNNPLKFMSSIKFMIELGYMGNKFIPEDDKIKEVNFSGFSANAGIYIKFR